MAVKKATTAQPKQNAERRTVFAQSDFPRLSLQESQKIAVGLWENFAGRNATPPDVALAIGVSPTSSAWRVLCGSSIAYGLTTGGHNADQITLTPLGRRLVAPEVEGEDLEARREAILKPRVEREFLERYKRAKFPNDTIAQNVMMALGLPKDRSAESLQVLKANGDYAGIVRTTPTGPFVALDSPVTPFPIATETNAVEEESTSVPAPAVPGSSGAMKAAAAVAAGTDKRTGRVFISHGKQKEFVQQLKELLVFGQLEPVVSVERETTAIPVPEKVFEDMRSCGAGVIHVHSEGECLDVAGIKHLRINENVLIEIGAAMALYGKRVILLVEKGVPLPSNLQGLYRCEYEGTRLDYEATMKLLKTFNQFRG